MNCLIDQKSIERVVLVENTDTAISMTQNEQDVPQNLGRVILLDPLSEYYPAPNYRSYATRARPLRYIQTNFKDVMEQTRQQIHEQEEKVKLMGQRLNENKKKLGETEKEMNEKRGLMNKLIHQESQLGQKLAELRAIEFPSDVDIEFLRKELEDEKQRKILIEAKIKKATEKKQIFKNATENKKTIMDKFNKQHQDFRQAMRTIQQQMESLQRSLADMNHDVSNKKRRIDSLTEDEKKLVDAVKKLEMKIKEMTAKIKGKRVDCKRSEDDLKQFIRSAERRIALIENNNEDITEVEKLMRDKAKDLDNYKSMYQALNNTLVRVSFLIFN
jgi:chromosome segregation ATPase